MQYLIFKIGILLTVTGGLIGMADVVLSFIFEKIERSDKLFKVCLSIALSGITICILYLAYLIIILL